jgi:hypothetical protein
MGHFCCVPVLTVFISKSKGLEPKLHDLALSLGGNETFEFERHNFTQTFARFYAIDSHIKFCVGNSSSVTM